MINSVDNRTLHGTEMICLLPVGGVGCAGRSDGFSALRLTGLVVFHSLYTRMVPL